MVSASLTMMKRSGYGSLRHLSRVLEKPSSHIYWVGTSLVRTSRTSLVRTSLVRTYLLGAGSRWRLLSEIYDVRFSDMLRKSNLPTAGGHILQPLAESLAGTRRKKYNKTVGIPGRGCCSRGLTLAFVAYPGRDCCSRGQTTTLHRALGFLL